MNILITGATGHLGRDVVRAAVEAGHTVRALSRRPARAEGAVSWVTADLGTGESLAAVVEGVDAVVHAASDPSNAATADVEGTRRLLVAIHRRTVLPHFIYVSIVGIDKIPLPYYRYKLEVERIIAESGVPYSILRVAQFHNFVDYLLRQLARFPLVLPVPAGFRVQSIATEDVAVELCDLVAAGPGGMLPDLVGPEAMSAVQAARIWVEVRRLRKVVVPFPRPGAIAAGFRGGHNTVPDRPGGRETWRAWLERQVRDGSTSTA